MNENMRKLALLGAIITIDPRLLDVLPSGRPRSPSPEKTPRDENAIRAAQQKRLAKQAKRLRQKGAPSC